MNLFMGNKVQTFKGIKGTCIPPGRPSSKVDVKVKGIQTCIIISRTKAISLVLFKSELVSFQAVIWVVTRCFSLITVGRSVE